MQATEQGQTVRVIDVGIALGSNLGDRKSFLQQARDVLAELSYDGKITKQAAIYGSCPVDCPAGSGEFLNTVIEIRYVGQALELLRQTQALEMVLGRPSEHGVNEPRCIDVDLLYFGDEAIDQKDLTIPHPRIRERRFVLEPLSEIHPQKRLPQCDQTVAELLAGLGNDEPPLTLYAKEW